MVKLCKCGSGMKNTGIKAPPGFAPTLRIYECTNEFCRARLYDNVRVAPIKRMDHRKASIN